MISERMGESMAWTHTHGVLLYVSGEVALDDAEWSDYLADCNQLPGSQVKVLIWVGSATPTPEQRDKIRRTFKNRQVMLAFITESVWTTGVMGAMSLWPGLQTRGFSAAELSDGLRFLGVGGGQRSGAFQELRSLRDRFDRRVATRWRAPHRPRGGRSAR